METREYKRDKRSPIPKNDTVSKVMSANKGKNTKPELIIRKYLFHLGFRYRLHQKKLPGIPDIVLKKYQTIIFVNGCFWHGHECKIGSGKRTPKNNSEYWQNKISKNKLRFDNNVIKLTEMGWRVIVIWECEIFNNEFIEKLSVLKK